MTHDLKSIRKVLKMNQVQFSSAIDIAQPYLSEMESGKKPVSEEVIKRIREKFGIELIDGLEKKEDIISIPLELTTTEQPNLVPLIPIAAQAGSLIYYADSVGLRDCEWIISPIPGADYAIRVSGESMAPEYPNGSQVLIKRIDPDMFIDWGKVYVLDTQNGTVMKQLAPGSKPDRVKCISKNPDPVYAPFEVMLQDVIGVYRVLLCMSVK